MISLRVLTLCFLVSIGARAAEPVAIVYSLTGEASLLAPDHRPLRLFERLPAGAIVEAGATARVELAFGNGRRYELGGSSRVKLGPNGLASRTGPVRPLPEFPPLPRLAPIAAKDRPGPRAAAVQIRTEIITGLHPDYGVTSLPSEIRLRFDPVPAAPGYRIRILDQTGETRFEIDTQDTKVDVPPGALEPGESYRWTVETRGRPGAVARGEATLILLDQGRARAREKLRNWIERSGSAGDRALLTAVDHALGLSEPCQPGLVIETVAPGSAASLAGLMPGDRLLSWCKETTCHELRTPFDWLDVQMDELQRGGVVVEGTRGSESLRWKLLPTFQGITVSPMERTAKLAEENLCPDAALWLQFRAGQLHATARQWAESDAAYESALAQARSIGTARAEPHLHMAWSEALLLRGDMARARQQLEHALSLEENDQPEGLGVATVLIRLGNVTEKQDDLEEAGRLYRRAHDMVVRAAPGSGGEAAVANNLAVTAGRRGDLAQAESHAARALAIREKLTPESVAMIPALLNYGNLIYTRGDYAGAEAAFLRAKGILETSKPESVELATVLHNLGVLANERRDHDSAEDFFQREHAIFKKIDPSGNLLRESLAGLGEVALRQGQGAQAEKWWRDAQEISGKLNPKGLRNIEGLIGLAAAARLQGKYTEAENLLASAEEIWKEVLPDLCPGSLDLHLGLLFFETKKDKPAETHLRAAISCNEQVRKPLPEGYHALARLQARGGRLDEAAATFRAAIDSLEWQRTNLGGAKESQWLYGSALGNLYLDAAENQIALGHSQEAWQFVERGRARGFQDLLAQRDLRFADELPADLYAERHRLTAEYDRVQAALSDWTPEQGLEKMEELQGRLRDLRLEQAGIEEKVRRASPRLASPAPLDLPAARAALDPGTVLLTYAVGNKRSLLFVIEASGARGPGVSLYPLAIGEAELAKEVEALRSLLARPDTLLPALRERSRKLYDLLIRPAEPVLAKADRWLISPDGPLHSLPFAALLSKNRYLAELKPIHIAASAAVYKEIKATRSKAPSGMATDLLAVGDPYYSDAPTDPELRAALRRGPKLEPLPASRGEVKSISKLYSNARTLLGQEATEEAVKSLGPRARRLHFASHGLLDQQFPLNSALALSSPGQSQPGRDNGLLQAWELLEEVRLDADLVTLSACDSGLGKEMGREGLVGLVRAFQFAGARSVLASLWSVSDDSTADLMTRFYGYLQQGRSKDEALRAAQADLIRSQGFSHPYYWAAFQLTGDWKSRLPF